VGFCPHRPALTLLGGIASRLLAQPALRAEPVFSPLSRGDSWDASRQIAQPVAFPISHPHDKDHQEMYRRLKDIATTFKNLGAHHIDDEWIKM
jgi:hypothetical protein